MQVEVNIRDIEIHDVVAAAQRLEAVNVDIVSDGEIRRDPFVTMALVAGATTRIGLATAVTIAFARSPMVVAYAARNLHDLSGGRFSVGLGTQVKRHIERRFSESWERPGPRLREYVRAVRNIWQAWDGETELAHHGEHYNLDLMTSEFALPPSRHGKIDLAVAAVNPYNLATAARYADTVRLHPFCTPSYLTDVILPTLDDAADSRPAVVGGGFIATGGNEESVWRSREAARHRIAFYGTTRTYHPVLRHHGWGELAINLRRRADEGRWDELAELVPEEVMEEFVTSATYDRLGAALAKRYLGKLDRIQLPCPPFDAPWGDFATAVADIGSAIGDPEDSAAIRW